MKVLGDVQFKRCVDIVEQSHSPADSGQLPSKVNCSFADFTADQWQNWTTVFSCVAVREVLSGDHLRCWMLFVKACKLFCSHIVKVQNIDAAHEYLAMFLPAFQDFV